MFTMKEEALKLANELDDLPLMTIEIKDTLFEASAMIRRLVEELDKKQQCLVEASGMLFNYKYELDLERAMSAQLKEELDKAQQDLKKYDELAFDNLTNLTPCEEIRRFQDVQNGVFSPHNACCYREDCRTVWNDWEKVRSSMMPLSDEEILDLCPPNHSEMMNEAYTIDFARAIEERHGIK